MHTHTEFLSQTRKKKKETQCKKPEQSTDCFFFEHWTRVREWQERFRLRTLGMGSTGEAKGTERHFLGFKEDKPLFGIGGTSGRKPAFFWVGWWSIWFSLRSKKNLTRNGGFMMGTKNNEVREKKNKVRDRGDDRLDTKNCKTLTNTETWQLGVHFLSHKLGYGNCQP